MCVFSFLVAAGFEPMYFSLGSEHLIHYPILTPKPPGCPLLLLKSLIHPTKYTSFGRWAFLAPFSFEYWCKALVLVIGLLVCNIRLDSEKIEKMSH